MVEPLTSASQSRRVRGTFNQAASCAGEVSVGSSQDRAAKPRGSMVIGTQKCSPIMRRVADIAIAASFNSDANRASNDGGALVPKVFRIRRMVPRIKVL